MKFVVATLITDTLQHLLAMVKYRPIYINSWLNFQAPFSSKEEITSNTMVKITSYWPYSTFNLLTIKHYFIKVLICT